MYYFRSFEKSSKIAENEENDYPEKMDKLSVISYDESIKEGAK